MLDGPFVGFRCDRTGTVTPFSGECFTVFFDGHPETVVLPDDEPFNLFFKTEAQAEAWLQKKGRNDDA